MRWLAFLILGLPIAIVVPAPARAGVDVFLASARSRCCRWPRWIGLATEHAATRLGSSLGGLLNATFGNAAELIITIFALRRGLTDLVKASITGSIIGNTLLILGLSAFLGGVKHGTQRFDVKAAGAPRRDDDPGGLGDGPAGGLRDGREERLHPRGGLGRRLDPAAPDLRRVHLLLLLLAGGSPRKPRPAPAAHLRPGRPGASASLSACSRRRSSGPAVASELLVHAVEPVRSPWGCRSFSSG